MGCGGVPSASMVGVSESGDVAELPVGVVVAVLVNRTAHVVETPHPQTPLTRQNAKHPPNSGLGGSNTVLRHRRGSSAPFATKDVLGHQSAP